MNPEKYKRLVAAGDSFWSRVDQSNPDGCWPWLGAVNEDGYGHMSLTRAHRAAWMLTHGIITTEQHVLHRCDNPPCCNPSHLFLGNQLINNADRDAKGRQCRGEDRGAVFRTALGKMKRENPERYKQNYGIRQRGTGNPMVKLTEDDVRYIRKGEGTQDEMAARFGVSQTAISKIRRRDRWGHVADAP